MVSGWGEQWAQSSAPALGNLKSVLPGGQLGALCSCSLCWRELVPSPPCRKDAAAAAFAAHIAFKI